MRLENKVSLQPARKLHYIYPLKISTAGHQSQFYAKECQVVFCSVGSGSERDCVIWKEIIVIEV